MRILITGSDSFLGKNLFESLYRVKEHEITTFNSLADFDELYDDFDVVYHLLAEYRNENVEMFTQVNVELTKEILQYFRGKKARIILVSSEQSGNGTPYGDSRYQEEEIIKEFSRKNENSYAILRLAHEFGKWNKPNFNSVVATFCHNIARGEEIIINNPLTNLRLEYIDDIVAQLIEMGEQERNGYYEFSPVYNITVGELAKLLQGFKDDRIDANISDVSDELIKKLYSTYLTYIPEDGFDVKLKNHVDNRGAFAELLHFQGMGQVSINISKPGITKGNHWHDTKTEKFIVVAGEGRISLRKVGTDERIDYIVSGEEPRSIDIPPGYTHSITNIGNGDLVTVIWANELFEPQKPDTYFMEV